MIVKMNTNAVLEKMAELCSALLQQDEYKELRQMIDQFTEDENAIEQYERFLENHRTLQQKDAQGLVRTEAEINDYEQEERALYNNDVIRRFLYAQKEFNQLHNSISKYFTTAIELNKIPETSEMQAGGCGCGGSCGCGGEH